MEGKFLNKNTPGRAVQILMGFHTHPHLRIQNLPQGFSHWNCAHWNHLLMPGHPEIYSEAIKLTFSVTHLHKTPPFKAVIMTQKGVESPQLIPGEQDSNLIS